MSEGPFVREMLFAVDADKAIVWTSPSTPEEMAAVMRRGWEAMKREALGPPRRHVQYVSPHQFEEYVAAGICDREGNFL